MYVCRYDERDVGIHAYNIWLSTSSPGFFHGDIVTTKSYIFISATVYTCLLQDMPSSTFMRVYDAAGGIFITITNPATP